MKGYALQFRVDFSDTFAPFARLDTIRILLAITAHFKWKIFQMYLKSAFLNGWLNEKIFVEQPERYIVEGQEDKLYLFRKTLYGLKQAPRAWYSRINEYLMSLGFERSPNEHTLYVREIDDEKIFISLYVDDLLVTGTNSTRLQDFKNELHKEFEMNDLGEMSFFLGMEVWQSANGIFVSQKKYANELLKKFAMKNCKPVNTPLVKNLKLCKNDGAAKVEETKYKSMVGCLLYLTVARPDIMYAVSLISRFMNE